MDIDVYEDIKKKKKKGQVSDIAFLNITNRISYYRTSCYHISAAIRQLVLLELVSVVHVILAFQLGTELPYKTDWSATLL